MKETFLKLPEAKQQKIVRACIEEFGEYGYERGSTDRIIKRAGISKGGLYEYISTKEELFLYTVEYTYRELYGYLERRIRSEQNRFPEDILERIWLVSRFAIDFYIEHPEYIMLIVKIHRLNDKVLEEKVRDCFERHFTDLFGSASADRLKYDRNSVIDLLMWLLLKTRYEFLSDFEQNKDREEVKKHYLDNWRFYLSVLRNGIYVQDSAAGN